RRRPTARRCDHRPAIVFEEGAERPGDGFGILSQQNAPATAQLEGDRDAVLARLDHQPNGTFQDRRDAPDIDGPQAVERLIVEPARLALTRLREAVPDAFPEEVPSLARPEALSGPIDEAEAPLTIEDVEGLLEPVEEPRDLLVERALCAWWPRRRRGGRALVPGRIGCGSPRHGPSFQRGAKGASAPQARCAQPERRRPAGQ